MLLAQSVERDLFCATRTESIVVVIESGFRVGIVGPRTTAYPSLQRDSSRVHLGVMHLKFTSRTLILSVTGRDLY